MLIGIFDPMGAQSDRLRCEVCQNLILSPMNTGFLRYAVLQQCLPFTVCAEGCETTEEQSNDEVRTSQVPERSEGKTKVIRDSAYRLRYAPKGARQQRSRATMRSAHLKCLNEVKVKRR